METLQVNRKKIEKLSTVLNNSRIKIFEYLVDEDTLVVYNNKFHIEKTIAGYMDYIDNKSKIHPEDREKIKQIYKEAKEATVEIREFGEDGDIKHSVLEFTKIVDEDGKLCGDVDFGSLEGKAAAATPVPGGVGAVTTAVLAKHLVQAAQRR